MMECYVIPVTSLQQNCSLLCCGASGKAAVVDPGGDVPSILALIEEQGVSVDKILLTHGHMDHVGGTAELQQALGVPVEGPAEGDRPMIAKVSESARSFGMAAEPFEPDRWLVDGDTVTFGDQELLVRHCPGHTPGHVVYFHQGTRIALVGDVLFQGSVGRTDFPGGSHEQLVASIKERLWPLGDDVTFVPGHGPASTFGMERKINPFVADTVTG